MPSRAPEFNSESKRQPTSAPARAFAHEHARVRRAADECFSRPGVSQLTMPMATTGWRRADRAERVLLDERDRRLQDEPRARNVAEGIVWSCDGRSMKGIVSLRRASRAKEGAWPSSPLSRRSRARNEANLRLKPPCSREFAGLRRRRPRRRAGRCRGGPRSWRRAGAGRFRAPLLLPLRRGTHAHTRATLDRALHQRDRDAAEFCSAGLRHNGDSVRREGSRRTCCKRHRCCRGDEGPSSPARPRRRPAE